jgi:hypothetical protein
MIHSVGLGFALGAKHLAAHSAHALAAQGALVVHHPLSTATQIAIHHGLTSAAAEYHGPLVNTVATGAAAASSTPTSVLYGTGVIATLGAKPVVSRLAWQSVRELWLTRSLRPS